MKIIGLAGKARAGKDTAAGFILEWCKEHDLKAERLALADPLKVSVAAAFGIAPDAALDFCDWLKQPGRYVIAAQLEGHQNTRSEDPQQRVSGREFLQRYGTESHRDVFGSDFWVEVAERDLAARECLGVDVVVITDCRFPNEASMVNEQRDGEVWEVVRPDNASLKDGLEAHSSEVGLPDGAIEFQINNDGTPEDLRSLIGSVCESNLTREAV